MLPKINALDFLVLGQTAVSSACVQSLEHDAWRMLGG